MTVLTAISVHMNQYKIYIYEYDAWVVFMVAGGSFITVTFRHE